MQRYKDTQKILRHGEVRGSVLGGWSYVNDMKDAKDMPKTTRTAI